MSSSRRGMREAPVAAGLTFFTSRPGSERIHSGLDCAASANPASRHGCSVPGWMFAACCSLFGRELVVYMRAWPRMMSFEAMQGSFRYWRPAATGGSTSASLARPYHLCERMARRPVTFEISPIVPCGKPAGGVSGRSILVDCLRVPAGLLPTIWSAPLRGVGPRSVPDRAMRDTPSGSRRPHGEPSHDLARAPPRKDPRPPRRRSDGAPLFPCRRPATLAPRRPVRFRSHLLAQHVGVYASHTRSPHRPRRESTASPPPSVALGKSRGSPF